MDKRTKEYKELMKKKVPEDTPTTQPNVYVETDKSTEKVPTNGETKPPSLLSSKKPTKPWEKHGSHKPWRMDSFNLVRKREGFRCRFVNEENVERRIRMGYEIADTEFYGGVMDVIVDDGSPLGKRIVRRRQILMEITEEGAKWHEKQNEMRIKAMQRSAKDIVVAQAKKDLEKIGVTVQITDESKNLGMN